jgi:hypothetical protein
MDFRRLPICVFSFNRVAYLRATLESLRDAMSAGGMCGPVLLFQDGAWNEFSRQNKTPPQSVAASRQAFQDIIPYGVVLESATNLGIAGNIYRGECWAFETMRYPAALFFEDDMVVSRDYFRAMAGLYALAQAQPRIAMFAAYGADGRATLDEQLERRTKVGPMHHNWAFGLTRDAWLKRETLTRDYMASLAGAEYRDRPLDRIAAWYGRLGWPPLPTSQDIAKSVALNTLGFVRVASVAICARNIGEIGHHYTPSEFGRLGFADVAMFESDAAGDASWVFDPLSEAEVDGLVAEQRADIMRVRFGAEAFIGSTALIDALRVIRSVGADALLHCGPSRLIASVAGFYPDRWSYPVASIVFSASANLREVTLDAIAAQHLPPGTSVEFLLNGQLAAAVWLEPGLDFSVTLMLPQRLDGLEKVLAARCSVNADPYSVGFNEDRRPLGFLLLRLALLEQDGTRTTVEGETLVGQTPPA